MHLNCSGGSLLANDMCANANHGGKRREQCDSYKNASVSVLLLKNTSDSFRATQRLVTHLQLSRRYAQNWGPLKLTSAMKLNTPGNCKPRMRETQA
eukprot:2371850-Amphidinium_carterae.1